MAEKISWERIKTEYITTDISCRKLAEKHGIAESSIFAKASKEHWVEQRERHQSKTVAKAIDAISERKVDRAAKLLDVADLLMDKVKERIEAVGALEMGTQEFRHLSATIKDLKEIQMIRSDADIREQEARIANLRKQAESENEDRSIEVIIQGDLQKYSN